MHLAAAPLLGVLAERDPARPRINILARDDSGHLIQPTLRVDSAAEVACVFLAGVVAVACPPLAVGAFLNARDATTTDRWDPSPHYERLLWREAHQALAKAEELGWWATSTPVVWGSAPGNYQFVSAAPGENLALRFAFTVGSPAAKVYAELVGEPGLGAIVAVDRGSHYFLGVKFRQHAGVRT
jgi:hypothetical protein